MENHPAAARAAPQIRPAPSRLLFGTLRGRLIISVAAVQAVMMVLFITDFTLRQRATSVALVGASRKAAGGSLASLVPGGVAYALMAALIGSIIAWYMGRRITRRLYAVQGTIDEVRTGNRLARSAIVGTDEAAVLAREFNSMLDALEARDLELRAGEEKYRALIQKVQTAIMLHDAEGRVLDSNPLARQLLGLPEGRLRGRALDDPEWRFLREDRSALPVAEFPAAVVLSTGKPLRDFVAGICRPEGGDPVWVLVNAEPEHDLEGRVARIIVSFTDITRLKQAEAGLQEGQKVFRTLVENSPDIIARYDRNCQRTYVNPRYLQEAGIPKAQLLASSPEQRSPLPPAGAGVLQGLLHRVLESGAPDSVDVPWPRADGREHWFNISAFPECDREGRVTSVMTISRNITERKLAEDERLSNLRLLESLDHFNRAIQGTGDLETMMNTALGAVLALFDCDRAYLLVPCDPATSTWKVAMERARPEYRSNQPLGTEFPAGPDYQEGSRRLLETDGPLAFGEGSPRPFRPETLQAHGFRSILAMALHPKVGPAWQLGIQQCSRSRVWTRAEERLAQEIGRRLTDGLTSLLAYRDLCIREAEHRAIVNAVPDLLYRVHRNGTITDFRKPGKIELYVPPGEFIGRPITEVLPPEVARRAEAAIEEALRTDELCSFLYDLTVGDGPRFFEARVVACGADEVLVVVRDITDRARAEAALEESEAKSRSILEHIGIGVSLISPRMEILELNHRMREWFPAIEPGQRPICYRAFNSPPREAPCDYCPTRLTLQDGQVHEATSQTPREGGVRNYRILSSPVFNAAGEVTAAIEMVEDITERQILESQLRQAQKMESVGRLAGGVAHDFNNMLGVIIGHSELALREGDPVGAQAEHFQEIRKAAERSAGLTRQLLAFARKQPVVRRVLDLNETVERMLGMLRRLIGEDIELVWLPGAGGAAVKVDPSQIDQVLTNLCVNARDAIDGVGRIAIETRPVALGDAYCASHPGAVSGEYVMLAVNDDGRGMDRETLGRLFEPFFTTKPMGRGTGLGLATVYGIVKQNEGFIDVTSSPGQGTSFEIYLPRHWEGVDPVPGLSEPSPATGGHEVILLVEDEPAVLALVRTILRRLGYRVLSADRPTDALRIATEHADEIHLLMTDVVMPQMHGKDLAKQLAEIRPGLKCLFMSGYATNVLAHHGALDEGVTCIQKPFTMEALAVELRNVLDRK